MNYMSSYTTAESKIICTDNVTLKATIYTPINDIKGAILIGPATGIKNSSMLALPCFLLKMDMA